MPRVPMEGHASAPGNVHVLQASLGLPARPLYVGRPDPMGSVGGMGSARSCLGLRKQCAPATPGGLGRSVPPLCAPPPLLRLPTAPNTAPAWLQVFVSAGQDGGGRPASFLHVGAFSRGREHVPPTGSAMHLTDAAVLLDGQDWRAPSLLVTPPALTGSAQGLAHALVRRAMGAPHAKHRCAQGGARARVAAAETVCVLHQRSVYASQAGGGRNASNLHASR